MGRKRGRFSSVRLPASVTRSRTTPCSEVWSARAKAGRSAMLAALTLAFAAGCEPDLDITRRTSDHGTFGEILYAEGCQRVAWVTQVEEQAAGARSTVDVSGSTYIPVCWDDQPAPDEAPAKVKAIQGQRAPIVASVDAAMPDDLLPGLESFLEALVPLHDDGTTTRVMRSTGRLLQTLMDDPGVTPALARLSVRGGFRPTRDAAGLAEAVLRFPAIDDLLAAQMDLLLDGQGVPGPELHALLKAASLELRAAQALKAPDDPQRTLRLALNLLFSPSTDVGDTTVRPLALRDARGVAAVTPDANGGVPAPFVDGNGDKLPDLDAAGRFVGGNSKPLALASPFALPGEADPKGTKRDAQGRFVNAGNQPVYRYSDLGSSVLAAVLRESAGLLDPKKDDLLGLVFGAGALLGDRTAKTRDYQDASGKSLGTLAYRGFSVDKAPLLDLVHAFVQVLGAPQVGDLLAATRTLLTTQEDGASRLLAAAFDANDRGKLHAEAAIPPTSTLYDDLAPIIARVLRVPGLAEDLMNALEDPHVRGLAPMIALQMTSNDRVALKQDAMTNGGNHSSDLSSVAGRLVSAPDRSGPDSDWNQSVMQRMAHLVHDANNAPFCNKDGARVTIPGLGVPLPFLTYKPCEMFKIDDLALFFVLTIADQNIVDDPSRPETRKVANFYNAIQDSKLQFLINDNASGDNFLENLAVQIQGFTRFPSPQAAARSLFLDPAHQPAFLKNATDPILCADGDRFIEAHNDSIFAWELPLAGNPSGFPDDNFYDAVRPLVNAFARHDECLARDLKGNCSMRRNAAKIFVDLFATLHRHWASPRSMNFGHRYQATSPNDTRFSTGDAVVSYEPLIAEVLRADLVPALIDFSPTLNRLTLDGTPNTAPARPVLLQAFRYLFDPGVTPDGLAYRDGHTQAVTSDGKTVLPRVTPYYLLADAYAGRRAALDAASAAQQGSWRAATTDLVDQALTVEKVGGKHQLKNRRMRGVVLAIVDFLRQRVAAHGAAGDLDQWVHKDLTSSLASTVDGPLFAALVDLSAKLEANDGARTQLQSLLVRLVDPTQSDASYETSLLAIGDLAQVFLDDKNLVPIARALGTALDPDPTPPAIPGGAPSPSPTAELLGLMNRARAIDPNRPARGDTSRHTTLVTLLRNFVHQPAPTQPTPLGQLADSLAEVNRVAPGHGGDLDAADFRHILGEVRTFLVDEERGFLRFIAIVQNRNNLH